MSAPAVLRLGVAACALGAGIVLVLQLLHTRSFGTRPAFAPAAGNARRGLVYAFGPGMAPAAKESTRTHPFVYLIGLSYHLGIFTALAVLLWTLAVGGDAARPALPRSIALALVSIGAAAGLLLMLRRLRAAHLRAISVPDDYVANLLTTAAIALAGACLLWPRAEAAFLVSAMLLLAYAPLGKIRHCLFFFASRAHLGRHYGRRGTFPPGP